MLDPGSNPSPLLDPTHRRGRLLPLARLPAAPADDADTYESPVLVRAIAALVVGAFIAYVLLGYLESA